MHNLVFIGDVSGNKASITTSGQLKVDATVNATAQISGQPVQISGQTVIANVVTDISGQTVAVSTVGSITALPVISVSGNMVSISGQPVTATLAVGPSLVSGQTVYLVNDGINNVVKVSGQTLIIPFTSVSGNMVSVSGQAQSVSGNAVRISGSMVSVSGQPANVSGATVSVSGIVTINSLPLISISGNMVSISGQPVVASVTTNISGQIIYTVSGNNTVQISGETLFIDTSISPLDVTVANNLTISTLPLISVSGNAVRISGSMVSISGQAVSVSGNMVSISGQVVNVSGSTVSVSGIVNIGNSLTIATLPLISVSGNIIAVSGVVRLDPGFTHVSGDAVRISGSMVSVSGQAISISGNMVSVSGQVVNVSGNTVSVSGIVQDRIPTEFRVRPLLPCVEASGGTRLLSGGCAKMTIVNAGVSGQDMYIGSQTEPPFSGHGIKITAGNGYTLDINNFDVVRICSSASGAKASYGGVVY
jgi:hypothetical protein